MPSLEDDDDENNNNNQKNHKNQHCAVEKWHKKPGDVVERDDVLCEISTPYGFGFGLQIDDEEVGTMGAIHVGEGGPGVPAGTPLCTIYHPEQEEEQQEPDANGRPPPR